MSSAGENQSPNPGTGDSSGQKGKSKWQQASTPVKAGIIGGGALGCFLLLSCCIGSCGLWWYSSGTGKGPGAIVNIVKKRPPYSETAGKIESKAKAEYAELEKKHGSIFKAPNNEVREANERVKKEADPLLATVNPPAIALDATCEKLLSEIEVDKATYAGDTGWIHFPVKYKVGIALKGFDSFNKFRVKLYDVDGAVIEECGIHQSADASPGERMAGYFSVLSYEKLGKVASFKVFSK